MNWQISVREEISSSIARISLTGSIIGAGIVQILLIGEAQ